MSCLTPAKLAFLIPQAAPSHPLMAVLMAWTESGAHLPSLGCSCPTPPHPPLIQPQSSASENTIPSVETVPQLVMSPCFCDYVAPPLDSSSQKNA